MARYHGYGTVTKEYKSLKPTKSMCFGCRDDYYNHGNASTSGQCWMFESAKVVDKEAHRDIYTVEREKFKKTLSCYHGVNK